MPEEAGFSVQSTMFKSVKRDLSAQFSEYRVTVDQPFTASVTMFDLNTGYVAENLDWNVRQQYPTSCYHQFSIIYGPQLY